MARSPLFSRLQQIAQRIRAQRTASNASDVAFKRRDLLRAAAVSTAAISLARVNAGCGGTQKGRAQSVAVIGAGMAGLHCAYRLKQAGLDVSVFESSTRAGGRMFTARGMFPDDQVVELGGELIDSNHRFMRALVDELELTLDDRFEGTAANHVMDTWFIDGAIVPEATVVEQFSAVAPMMLADMEGADEDDAVYEELDNTPLSDWLEQRVPVATYPQLHSILVQAYRGEFGLECDEQSALNLIYLIGSDDPDPFRIFGESDERYHVHGGNGSVTDALAERLDGHITLDRKLMSARNDGDGYALTFESADGQSYEAVADRVVFALPFSVLRDVDLSDLTLSDDKRTIIDELGYGTNAKIMGAFTRRVWLLDHNASGSATTDLPLQQTWDTSIGQAGDHGIITHFLGGDRGLASDEGTAEERFTAVLPDLDRVFAGTAEAYVADSAVRMHWPTHPHTKGSYTCYRPGQWAFWATEGVREGNVHFCGEHTSPEFQGWMEGAAETGGRVAMEILEDLNIALPAELEAVIDDDVALSDIALLSVSKRFPRRLLRLRQKQNAA